MQGVQMRYVAVCVQCESQVKRTSVAMGQAHPVWKEEVTFKSVQITSDLQVSLQATYCLIQQVTSAAHAVCRMTFLSVCLSV